MNPKVKVVIKNPASATWNVPGATFNDLNPFNSTANASAWYTQEVKPSATSAGGAINSVTLTLVSTITMPIWQGYNSGTVAQKQEWDRFYQAAKAHELRHHEIAIKGTNKLADTIRAATDLQTPQLQSIYDTAIAEIDKLQRKYDVDTQRGTTEGVVLDTSIGRKPGNVGGGGVGCFKSDTNVMMSDGNTKRISDVIAGDVLRVCTTDGQQVFDAELLSMGVDPHTSYNTLHFSDGSQMVISQRQPILTTFGAVRSLYLIPGAKAFTWSGEKDGYAAKSNENIEVVDIKTTYESIDLFCPDFQGDFCVFAGPNLIAFPGTRGGPIKN